MVDPEPKEVHGEEKAEEIAKNSESETTQVTTVDGDASEADVSEAAKDLNSGHDSE